MANPTHAYAGNGDSVIYEYNDGKKEKWAGGHRNWRNQNPGNVLSNSIQWNGKIGDAGGFCIFDDPESGKRATRIILSNRQREGKSLSQAIHSYAPSHENDTDAYIRFLEKYASISRNVKLSTLSPEKIEKIAQGIFIHEGTAIGTIEIINARLPPKKTGKYIWHTAHDEKVRPEHAARNGKIFDFANPPPGGNPGDDYNCRCQAEPLPEQSLKDIFKK